MHARREANLTQASRQVTTDISATGYEGQSELKALLARKRTGEGQDVLASELRKRGKSALDELLATHDVIVSLADGALPMYSAAAGKSSCSSSELVCHRRPCLARNWIDRDARWPAFREEACSMQSATIVEYALAGDWWPAVAARISALLT